MLKRNAHHPQDQQLDLIPDHLFLSCWCIYIYINIDIGVSVFFWGNPSKNRITFQARGAALGFASNFLQGAARPVARVARPAAFESGKLNLGIEGSAPWLQKMAQMWGYHGHVSQIWR